MFDVSTSDLALLRAVAQHGSFTAAATALGFTQSAVSKRVAALEAITAHRLFDRGRSGVHATAAGEVMLRHATTMLDALEAAQRELEQGADTERLAPVRLGAFASAIAGVVPAALPALAGIEVTLREGTSAALVRAIRAGTLDLALLAAVPPFHPPDRRDPPLRTETLADGELRVAVGAGHRLAGRRTVSVDELHSERWVIAHSRGDDHRLGVWPGATRSQRAPFVARDWLSKLRLVASGEAIATVPAVLRPALPPDVRTVAVTGEDIENRRLIMVCSADPRQGTDVVAAALRAAVRN